MGFFGLRKTMIQIAAAEVITPTGGAHDRYWLTDNPNITITAYPNALNKLCRLLVDLGLSGSAEVRGQDGKLRLTIASIERCAQRDLRDHPRKGMSMDRHRPFPGIAKAA